MMMPHHDCACAHAHMHVYMRPCDYKFTHIHVCIHPYIPAQRKPSAIKIICIHSPKLENFPLIKSVFLCNKMSSIIGTSVPGMSKNQPVCPMLDINIKIVYCDKTGQMVEDINVTTVRCDKTGQTLVGWFY